MTKRELIDEINDLNPTASPGFLAAFGAPDLVEYLEHLRWVCPAKERRPGREDAEPRRAVPAAVEVEMTESLRVDRPHSPGRAGGRNAAKAPSRGSLTPTACAE